MVYRLIKLVALVLVLLTGAARVLAQAGDQIFPLKGEVSTQVRALPAAPQAAPLMARPAPRARKGSWYAYWGWNEARYTRNDLHFRGDGYDFTLERVHAIQRQKPFTVKRYLNPVAASTPQFNARVGRYFREDLDLSIGLDHMKWVVKQNQFVAIRGLISGTDSEEDGTYTGESKQITRRWLEFEHTDGLNWFNIAARKHQRLFYWRWVQLTAYEGAAVGGLLPRTDATLFGRERHDHYRLAGYALGGSLGLNLTVWDHIFVQTELKGGFAHIVSGRTTPDPADKVSHHMLFGQAVLVFGGRWNFR